MRTWQPQHRNELLFILCLATGLDASSKQISAHTDAKKFPAHDELFSFAIKFSNCILREISRSNVKLRPRYSVLSIRGGGKLPVTTRVLKRGHSNTASLRPTTSTLGEFEGSQLGSAYVPNDILEAGEYSHEYEGQMIFKGRMGPRVPFFDAPIYTAAKCRIGKVSDILGPIDAMIFCVKCDVGILPSSVEKGEIVYIEPTLVLPISQVLANSRPREMKKRKPPRLADLTSARAGGGPSRKGTSQAHKHKPLPVNRVRKVE